MKKRKDDERLEENLDEEVAAAPVGRNRIFIIVLGLAAVALISWFITGTVGVSKEDFTTNIQNVVNRMDEQDNIIAEAIKQDVAEELSSFDEIGKTNNERLTILEGNNSELTRKVNEFNEKMGNYATIQQLEEFTGTSDSVATKFQELKDNLMEDFNLEAADIRDDVRRDIDDMQEQIDDVVLDVRDIDRGGGAGGNTYSGDVYVEIVDLDDSGWIWLQANAPVGYALLLEFYSADSSFPAVADFDITIRDDYDVSTKLGSTSLIRVFIEPIWSPGDWSDVELRLGYSHSDNVDYIKAIFVAINNDRNW